MIASSRSIPWLVAAVAAAIVPTLSQAIPENAPDGGVWLGGTVNVSPFVEASYIHDTNPNNARKQKDDLLKEGGVELKSSDGYTIRPGVNINIPGNCWKLAGRAYYSMVRYSEDDVDDRDDWGESFTFAGETDAGLMWRLSESVVQVDLEEQFTEAFPYNYSTRDRLEMTFGGSLSKRITDKCRLEVGGSYSKTDYDSDMLYDYERYGGHLGFAHQLTEKTDWTLSASHTIHSQEANDDEFPEADDTKSTKVLLGLKSRSTERVTFDVQGGVEFYEGNKNEDGSSNDKTSFTYSLGASWLATERLTVGLRGLGEYEPSEDIYGSSVDTKSIGINASYRMFERIRLSAGITYHREEYEHRIAKITDVNGNPYSVNDGGKNRDDDILDVTGRISFAINNYASIYAACTYHEVFSSIEDFEYDRTRYSVGAAVRY